MNRRQFNTLLAVAGLSPSLSYAQDWPASPITMLVPYPPGGNTDFVGRITSEWLRKRLGQSVVVKNQGGAGGTLATEALIRSKPDGTTLMIASIGQIPMVKFLYNVRYDPMTDLVPVANVASNPLVISVPANSRFPDLKSLIAFGRANPGALTVAHGGDGSMSHMSAMVFLQRAGITATLVGYRGGAPAVLDTMSGVADMYSANISEILAHIHSGRLRFLGVSSLKRIPQLPDVPVIADLIPGHEIETWNGVVAPKGTPQAVIDRLAAEVTAMLEDKSVQDRFTEAGSRVLIGEVKDTFAQRIQKDLALWTPLVAQIGVKPAN